MLEKVSSVKLKSPFGLSGIRTTAQHQTALSFHLHIRNKSGLKHFILSSFLNPARSVSKNEQIRSQQLKFASKLSKNLAHVLQRFQHLHIVTATLHKYSLEF